MSLGSIQILDSTRLQRESHIRLSSPVLLKPFLQTSKPVLSGILVVARPVVSIKTMPSFGIDNNFRFSSGSFHRLPHLPNCILWNSRILAAVETQHRRL